MQAPQTYTQRQIQLMQALDTNDRQKAKDLQALLNHAAQRKIAQGILPKDTVLLREDGIFGQRSRAMLEQLRVCYGLAPKADFCLLDKLVFEHPFSDKIQQYPLSAAQYINNAATAKKGLVLHHTASDGNPYAVANYFAKTPERVATHFVIGGMQLKDNSNQYDGQILQLLPLEFWAHHLNTDISNTFHNSTVVGVEICSWGGLARKLVAGEERFYTESGAPQLVAPEWVETLPQKFNGYQYFYKYTAAQCSATLGLICYLRDIYQWDLSNTNTGAGFFERNLPMLQSRVIVPLTAHTTWRKPKEKSDIYPNPLMLRVLEAVKLHKDYETALAYLKGD